MNKKTWIAVAVTAVIVLMVGGKIRSSVPFVNKLPTIG